MTSSFKSGTQQGHHYLKGVKAHALHANYEVPTFVDEMQRPSARHKITSPFRSTSPRGEVSDTSPSPPRPKMMPFAQRKQRSIPVMTSSVYVANYADPMRGMPRPPTPEPPELDEDNEISTVEATPAPAPKQVSVPRSVSPQSPSSSVSPGRALHLRGAFAPPVYNGTGNTAAFRSRSPMGDAHIRDLSIHTLDPKHSYDVGHGDIGRARSPGARSPGSSMFMSKTSIGDAHIKAVMTTSNPPRSPQHQRALSTIMMKSPRKDGGGGTAAFRSTTSIGDAHIKALPRPGQGSYDVGVFSTPRGSVKGTLAFTSRVPQGVAHIRALPQQQDSYATFF